MSERMSLGRDLMQELWATQGEGWDSDKPIESDLQAYIHIMEQNQVRLLTHDEEMILANAIREGDNAAKGLSGEYVNGSGIAELEEKVRLGQEARELMFLANWKLVLSRAKKYNRSSGYQHMMDLVQEGNEVLVSRMDRFDPDRGFKFSTYITWWIDQGMRRYMANHSNMIRIPVPKYEDISKIRRVRSYLYQEFDREPTMTEIADEMDKPVRWVEDRLGAVARHISLEAPLGDKDSDAVWGDVIEDEDANVERDVDLKSLEAEIEYLIEACIDPERNQEMMRARFGLVDGVDRTLAEVGNMYELSRERVRQIEVRSLKAIRIMGGRDLAMFLE